MSANTWILIGVFTSAIGLVSLSFGFVLKGEERATAAALVRAAEFSLAQSNFDLKLLVPEGAIERHPEAFALNRTLMVILNVREGNSNQVLARLHLQGQWTRDDGLMQLLSKNLVSFVRAERLFVLWQMSPAVEYVNPNLRKLAAGHEYQLDLMAIPSFAVPLVPTSLTIRTEDGVTHTLEKFISDNHGWYTATLKFDAFSSR